MADVYKGLTIEFRGDTSELSSALRKVRKEARETESDLKLANKALKADPNSARVLKSQQEAVRAQIKKTKEEVDTLRLAEKKLADEKTLTPEQQRQWNRLQSEIALAEQKLKGYQRELVDSVAKQATLTSALAKSGNALQGFSKRFDGVAKGMQSMGSCLTVGLTVPLAAAAGLSVKAATEIDTSLTNVKKTVDGTAEDYQRLKDAAIEFSKVNAVSASEILDIQSLGAQLGYSIDELEEFGEVVSGLDIATNMSAEDAASELAQFFNIMGESHEMTRNYGSTIVGLGNSFATTEADISHMAMRIAGAGKQIGLSSADVLGLSTALSSMGINAEAGGTAISTIMANIDKTVATNGENLETWASVANMSASEFSDAWGSDAVGTLSAVLVGMDEATQAGGNMSVMLEEMGITSIRQTDTFKRLASNSSFLGDAVAKANLAWEENVALDNEVANRNDSLAAKFEMLTNRVIAVADQVGVPLADALLGVVDAAEPLFDAIESGAKAFADMSVEERQVVLACAVLAGAMGPVLTVGGKLITAAGGVGKAMSRLSGHFARTGAEAKLAADGTLKAKGRFAALRGTAAALGGTILALVVANLVEYNSKAEAAQKATDGLRSTMNKVQYGSAWEGAERAADSYERVSKAAQEAIDSQAALADTVGDAWGSVEEDSQVARRCLDTIKELTDGIWENGEATLLSADKQQKLIAAVGTLNEVTGSTYSVVDATRGILSATNSEIEANTQAWMDNAKAQAAQEVLTDLYKQQARDRQALAAVDKELAEAEQGVGWWIGDFPVIADPASDAYHDLTKKHEELTEAAGATEDAIAYFEGQMSDAVPAEEDMAAATDDLAEAAEGAEEAVEEEGESIQTLGIYSEETMEKLYELLDAHPKLAKAMLECGWSAEELQGRLDASGVSGESLASAVESVGDKASNAFAKIEGASEASLAQMLENLRYNAECTRNWSSNLESLYDSTEDATIREFVRHMGEMGPEYAAQVQSMVDQGGDVLSELAYAWADAEEAGRAGALSAMGVTSDAVDAEWAQRVADAEAAAAAEASSLERAFGDATPATIAACASMLGQTVPQFTGLAEKYGVAGEEAIKAFALRLAEGESPAEAAAEVMAGAAKDGADSVDMEPSGDKAVDGYAKPLYGSSGTVFPAGQAMGEYGKQGAESVDFATSGRHAAQNFARGMRDGGGEVESASLYLADKAQLPLKHSVPKKGPLRNHGKGEREWGLHAAENFASGIESGASSVARASRALADAAAMGFASVPSDAALMASVSTDVAHRVSVDASGMESAVRTGLGAALASAAPSIQVAGDVTLDAGGLDASAADRLAESMYRSMLRGRMGG